MALKTPQIDGISSTSPSGHREDTEESVLETVGPVELVMDIEEEVVVDVVEAIVETVLDSAPVIPVVVAAAIVVVCDTAGVFVVVVVSVVEDDVGTGDVVMSQTHDL